MLEQGCEDMSDRIILPEVNQRAIQWRGQKSFLACSLLSLAIHSGCGASSSETTDAFREVETVVTTDVGDEEQTVLRSASRGSEIELASATSFSTQETQGFTGPEQLLQEIARLRTAPIDMLKQPVPGRPGEYAEVRLTPEQIEREKQLRWTQTIELATRIIARTHQDPGQEQAFNSAVHYLSDARSHLALTGKHEQATLLSQNAETLFQRDPTSFAAVECATRVLQLTQTLAGQGEALDPEWVLAYARQARIFGANFPQESHRAGVNVLAAARMCERIGQLQEAETCLAWIEQSLPQTPFADQAAGPLRRLRLVNEPLVEFGGSTLDGGYLTVDQLQGKPFLIAYWASNSDQFRADLPKIQSVVQQFRGRVGVVGVCLDADDAMAQKFVQQARLDWKQVFFSDPGRRGDAHPIARHYGVVDTPQYWLVDAQGVVKSVDVKLDGLEDQLIECLK